MNFNKLFAFLAILVLCVLGHQATEAHFLGKVGHRLDKAAKTVDKAQRVIAAGTAVAGAIGVAAA